MKSTRALERYNQWLEKIPKTEALFQELIQIKNNFNEIEGHFGKDLSFGTGGIRGIIGVGTNRINKYIIRQVTKGLADYLKHIPGCFKSVVIAHDTRRCSREFAEETAKVFIVSGVKVYFFKGNRPTPLLSFAVRHLNAEAGVVITASHNPPEYNGYKIYGEDGGQAVPEMINEIKPFLNPLDDFFSMELPSFEELEKDDLFYYIGGNVDKAYLECYQLNSLFLKKEEDVPELKTVYTPLHGTGLSLVEKVLDKYSFSDLVVVKEQAVEDEKFSTLEVPNPEDENAFKVALEYAKRENADIVIATDPDCDRVGVMARDKDDIYKLLDGNHLGVLILDYILSKLDANNKLSQNGYIIKTVVTGDLGKKIAGCYGLDTIETLTGFKYIGEQIKIKEDKGDKCFIFGYEESGGYLADTFVRDKDGVMGVLLACIVAAHHKDVGKSLWTALDDIYRRFGYYQEKLINIEFASEAEKKEAMERIDEWRNHCPREMAGYNVIGVQDFLSDNTGLPRENSLKLTLDNGSWICVRPSGTEPKLKIYVSAMGETYIESKTIMQNVSAFMKSVFN